MSNSFESFNNRERCGVSIWAADLGLDEFLKGMSIKKYISLLLFGIKLSAIKASLVVTHNNDLLNEEIQFRTTLQLICTKIQQCSYASEESFWDLLTSFVDLVIFLEIVSPSLMYLNRNH
jgi:hypothetical protein